MSTLESPITDEDMRWGGGLTCHSCGEPITEGGQWVEMRPYTAYAMCADCLKGEEE